MALAIIGYRVQCIPVLPHVCLYCDHLNRISRDCYSYIMFHTLTRNILPHFFCLSSERPIIHAFVALLVFANLEGIFNTSKHSFNMLYDHDLFHGYVLHQFIEMEILIVSMINLPFVCWYSFLS